MFNVVDSNTFNEQVLSAQGMVLVNFWAWWSDECRKMSSLMRKVDGILDEQDAIVQIDWDQQKQFASDLEVIGVPSLLIYVRGDEIARYSGIMSKDELIKRVLKAKEAFSKKGGVN
ncbi:thioredoxin family protein [candidate division KSB1 bacterium]|nr:thioredoxin family protein [candidate division KSB1 bacterium]